MKLLDKLFLNALLFAGAKFFAAGASALNDVGGGDGGGDVSAADGAGDIPAVGDETTTVDDTISFDDEPAEAQAQPAKRQDSEEPEIAEFKGVASARVRGLCKKAPELTPILQKHPEVRDTIEAWARQNTAYRELYPTIAEARQMREQFPNGLNDVQALKGDVQELERLNNDFYARDQEGNYSGHAQMLNQMFQNDREATVALFKQMPKEWARLDRESYNEVVGSIVGSVFSGSGIPNYLGEMIQAAKEAKQDAFAKDLQNVLNWMKRYSSDKPRPTPEQEQIARDRADIARQKQQNAQQDATRFHESFKTETNKLQMGMIKDHVAVKKLMEVKGVTEEKKNKIIDQIRVNTANFLKRSPSFMRQLAAAHSARNLQETLDIQKAAWSQQWLMNRMVRSVMTKEVPHLVTNNRDAIKRRAGAPNAARPDNKPGDNKKPTAPYQVGKQWFKPDGSSFTVAEVLAGKHKQA